MANGVYGGPTWRNTQNMLGSGQGMVTGRLPSVTPPVWQNTQNLLGSGWVGAQPPPTYRGGSRWPVTHPYGQAPVSGSVWSSTPRALPWLNQDNPLALNYSGGYSPRLAQAPATQQPPAVTAPGSVQPVANVPADVQQAGLSNWYLRFMEQHGGQTPEDFYRTSGYRREGLAEALADLDWSKGFQQMYGRPPSEDDWKAWYFQSRGGGNYGGRELWRGVKGASENEYRRMLAQATTKKERNKIKRYKAASGGAGWDELWASGKLTGKRYDQFVKEKGMTPEQYYASPTSVPGESTVTPGVTGPVNGVMPAPGYISAEELERTTGEPAYGLFPVAGPEGYPLQRPPRAPLWIPPQTYWQLR